MSDEWFAIRSLCTLPTFGTAEVLKRLYDALSPELPSDLQSTAVPSPASIPDAEVLLFNYDEAHSARFMVPNTGGGSVDFDWVMDRPNPLSFLTTHLAVAAPDAPETPENVIFMPGLNTFQQPHEGETTSEQRLRFYAKVMRKIPMSQLHPGSSKDQGDACIQADKAPALRALIAVLRPLLPDNLEPKSEGGNLIWTARQLDYMQAALSAFNLIDTPLKARLRHILNRTKEGDAEAVVLVGYSRSSIDLQAALQKHVEDCREEGESEHDIEARLRRLVTVVTIGSGKAGFPDGPAYIHVATFQDPLARVAGVTPTHNAHKAGRDAMFVNANSPLAEGSFDAHNFAAIMVQYVSILIAANKVNGFRELWTKHMTGELVVAENAEEMMKALIVLTDGTQWLFMPDEAWVGVGQDALPDVATAERVLREGMGDEYVDGMIAEFGEPKQLRYPPTGEAEEVAGGAVGCVVG